MENAVSKQQIREVVDDFRNASLRQKIKSKEERINDFLDAILDLKKELISQTKGLNELTSEMESLTWYKDIIDEECQKLLNELIVLASDLHNTIIRDEYVPLNNYFRPNGIAVDELKNFKFALNDFKETKDDLDSIFFSLLKNQDFNNTSQKLAELLP